MQTIAARGGHCWTLVGIAGRWWALLDVGGHCWTLVSNAERCWALLGHWWALLGVGCSNGWTLNVNPHSGIQPLYRMVVALYPLWRIFLCITWLLLGCMFVTMVESNAGDG